MIFVGCEEKDADLVVESDVGAVWGPLVVRWRLASFLCPETVMPFSSSELELWTELADDVVFDLLR